MGPYPCSRPSLVRREDVTEKKPLLSCPMPSELQESGARSAARAFWEYSLVQLAAAPAAGMSGKACPETVLGKLRRKTEGRRACPAEQAVWPVILSDMSW